MPAPLLWDLRDSRDPIRQWRARYGASESSHSAPVWPGLSDHGRSIVRQRQSVNRSCKLSLKAALIGILRSGGHMDHAAEPTKAIALSESHAFEAPEATAIARLDTTIWILIAAVAVIVALSIPIGSFRLVWSSFAMPAAAFAL